MTTLVQTWTLTVTFDGVAVSCLSARPGHGVDKGVATATIETTKTLADTIADGAAVIISASLNGGGDMMRFKGTYRNPDRNCSVSGDLATLTCEGTSYVMTYPLEKDLAFTGGAKQAPDALQTAARHIGNDTIAWYADTTGDGTSVSLTETPLVDSSFVWVAGRYHGTNSYPTSLDDKKIKRWSRIEVWQAGAKLGYANFDERSEQYSSMLDYTNDANWSDFEMMIAATIDASDGNLTFKLISGQQPGSSLYDEYEVKNVTWQTAGKNTVREIFRGMFKRVLGPSKYSVANITDLDGNTMKLGGNGLADAGQVRVARTETPLGFVSRIADLFGYKVFDCPDGITRVLPIRGQPVGTSAATFAEGTNILAVRRTTNPRDVYNSVRVEGWSGTNQDGVRVAYASQTATVDIEPSDVIPDPPGIALLRLSDSLLTSNALCVDVREIAEINHAESSVFIEWDTWPHASTRPGQRVTVDVPSVGFSGDVWLMSMDDDLSPSGFMTRMVGWAGGAAPFDGDADATDPDPAEVDIEPGDPRPAEEWIAFRPSGSVN